MKPKLTNEQRRLASCDLTANYLSNYYRAGTISGLHISTEEIALAILAPARSTYETMTTFLGYAQEFNHNTRESKKFERMLHNYAAMLVN